MILPITKDLSLFSHATGSWYYVATNASAEYVTYVAHGRCTSAVLLSSLHNYNDPFDQLPVYLTCPEEWAIVHTSPFMGFVKESQLAKQLKDASIVFNLDTGTFHSPALTIAEMNGKYNSWLGIAEQLTMIFHTPWMPSEVGMIVDADNPAQALSLFQELLKSKKHANPYLDLKLNIPKAKITMPIYAWIIKAGKVEYPAPPAETVKEAVKTALPKKKSAQEHYKEHLATLKVQGWAPMYDIKVT